MSFTDHENWYWLTYNPSQCPRFSDPGLGKADRERTFFLFGVIDRVVYSNYEPLATLAVVAGVTQRLRLVTAILLAPSRTTTLLAKQSASLDALSGGRLTLGLGVGA